MSIALQRSRTFQVLLMVDVAFVVMHLLTRAPVIDGEPILRRHEFLDMDAEISFPTWWQQSQLLVAAVLCGLIGAVVARSGGPRPRHWFGLAGIFLYLSVDEGTQLHEGFIEPIQRAFDITGGVLLFAWVIPGMAALAVFGVAYFRFWAALPDQPRWLMALGGSVFVAGALGFEMASGQYKTEIGTGSAYTVVVAAEELLEMIGASIFVLSLLTMAQRVQSEVGVSVKVEA